jgi:hypothetical protein
MKLHKTHPFSTFQSNLSVAPGPLCADGGRASAWYAMRCHGTSLSKPGRVSTRRPTCVPSNGVVRGVSPVCHDPSIGGPARALLPAAARGPLDGPGAGRGLGDSLSRLERADPRRVLSADHTRADPRGRRRGSRPIQRPRMDELGRGTHAPALAR